MKVPKAKQFNKYIQLQSPLTLDKYKDGTAQMRTANELQELTNYIPCDGYIYTREGIEDVHYTPETTPPAFDPKTDTRCYMILDFEDGEDLGRNVGLNRSVVAPPASAQVIYLFPSVYGTRNGSATWTTDCKEGSHALWITNNTAENVYAGTLAGGQYFQAHAHF